MSDPRKVHIDVEPSKKIDPMKPFVPPCTCGKPCAPLPSQRVISGGTVVFGGRRTYYAHACVDCIALDKRERLARRYLTIPEHYRWADLEEPLLAERVGADHVAHMGAQLGTLHTRLQRGLGIAAEDRPRSAARPASIRSSFNGASASLPRIAGRPRCLRWSARRASTGPRHRCRGSPSRR